MKVKSQLIDAQVESRAGAPTATKRGEIVLDTSDSNQVKYADGTVNRTIANLDQSQTATNKTFTSPVITTPTGIVKGDVGLGNVDNTSDATKDAAAATLENKTITSPVITTPTIDVELLTEQSSSPPAPSAGTKKFYAKDDGKVYTLDSDGNEIEVGSGSGGGAINYATSPDFESGIDSVTVTANLTKAEETTNPIRGTKSLKLTIDTLATTADYADIGLELFDEADSLVSKKIPISFEVKTDANYTADDVEFVVRDVTGGVDLPISTSNNGKLLANTGIKPYVGYFYSTTGNNDYDLRMNVLVAPSTDSNITIDNVKVGPEALIFVRDEGIIGEIISSASTTSPTNHLYCDGAAVSRSTYPDLFTEIGTSYGNGDGSTTFNIPDFRGLFLRGQDDGSGNDPDAAGRTVNNAGGNSGDNIGSEQTDMYKSHRHNALSGGAGSTVSSAQRLSDRGADVNQHTSTSGISLAGGNETRPKNVNVRYYIRFSNGQGNLISTTKALFNKIGNPIGEIISSASTVTPASYLYCDGAAVNRVTYSDLFAEIGTNYGNGDGSTTFNTPDLRGLFLRGQDDGSGNDSNAGTRTVNNSGGNTGDNVGSEQTDIVKAHTHTHQTRLKAGAGVSGGGQTYELGLNSTDYTSTSTDTTNSQSPTGGTETRPKNVNVRYYIRYEKDTMSVYGVYGETELIESVDTGTHPVITPSLATWYTPAPTWNTPVTAGSFNLTLQTIIGVQCNAGSIISWVGLSTSATPGVGLFYEQNIGNHGTNTDSSYLPVSLNYKNFTTASDATIYIQIKATNFSGASSLTLLNTRNNLGGTGGILSAERIK